MAPHEPIYKARRLDKLSELMMPDLQPDQIPKPLGAAVNTEGTLTHKLAWSDFIVGVRHYTETIGQINVAASFEFNDEEIDKTRPDIYISRDVRRTTSVRLFPDSRLALNSVIESYEEPIRKSVEISPSQLRQAKRDYHRFGAVPFADPQMIDMSWLDEL